MGLLLVDYSSAFNTLLPHRLVDLVSHMLPACGSGGRSQRVVGPHIQFSARAPTGLHAELLLYTHHSNTRLYRGGGARLGGETAYRDQVERWSLVLNTSKTKELIIDFQRKREDIKPHRWGPCGEAGGLPLPGGPH